VLVGPPEQVKRFCKAVAGEAGVPFFSISGSICGTVCRRSSRVRDLFEQAKTSSCIIFIDELDAIGVSPSNGFTAATTSENKLNQLLTEMDGFAAACDSDC